MEDTAYLSQGPDPNTYSIALLLLRYGRHSSELSKGTYSSFVKEREGCRIGIPQGYCVVQWKDAKENRCQRYRVGFVRRKVVRKLEAAKAIVHTSRWKEFHPGQNFSMVICKAKGRKNTTAKKTPLLPVPLQKKYWMAGETFDI